MEYLNFGQHRVYIYDSAESLKYAATEHLLMACAERAKHVEMVSIALSGGSTPIGVYQNLVNQDFYSSLRKSVPNSSTSEFPWSQSLFFFGDERYVAHDDPQSNFKMAKEAFLDSAPISNNQIFPIPTHCEVAETCAKQYAQQLLELEQISETPVFDYILLGIGDDGHTASLFPDTSIIDEHEKNVAAVYVAKFQAWRISLTFKVLNHARNCTILVSGEAKAPILADVMVNKKHQYPIGKVENQNGLNWFVDQAAASKL